MTDEGVGRIACLDLPAFPLQLLLRDHPDWASLPVVAVADDRPQGVILWANAQARELRILPGQRYANALSLASNLRAGVVSKQTITDGIDDITERLRQFSPEIEPATDEPGVFWLNSCGLCPLYESIEEWTGQVADFISQIGLIGTIAVGFSRFGTYAVTRHRRKAISIIKSADDERRLARRVPLAVLGMSPKMRDALLRLGISSLGEFIDLPASGILKRFGSDLYRLHRLAAGKIWDPLRPRPVREPVSKTIQLIHAVSNSQRLLFLIKRALDPILDQLAQQHRALTTLYIDFHLETEPSTVQIDMIRPAEPTLDARRLLRLAHLRLESNHPKHPVIELRLDAEHCLATQEQLTLFNQKPKRDLRSADDVFAQLRAIYGNQSVVKPVLRNGHLPEARYTWEPIVKAVRPKPTDGSATLVRRLFSQPKRLPAQSSQTRDDGWLLSGLQSGPVVRIVGPYILSGGWWLTSIHREYHFAETRRGDVLWVYYDRRRRRWFLHGQVE